MMTPHLDSRSWLVWAAAVMAVVLLGRNPWILLELLVIVLIVRATWQPVAAHGLGWFVRIAGTLVVIGVAFNVLTVHAGNRVLAEIPASWPVIGGAITLNALVYGVLGGMALFILVITGITVSSLISWNDLFHQMPQRLSLIAVTGSVAWAFLPQTAVAWQQIRETQAMRGHRLRGVRAFVPIVVPLLAGGLERSLTLAEALESRGFGVTGSTSPANHSRTREMATVAGIVTGIPLLAVAAYSLATGRGVWAMAAGVIGGVILVVAIRGQGASGIKRTRYRIPVWTRSDTLVTGAATIAGLTAIARFMTNPESLTYYVYPTVEIPPVDPVLMVLIAFLLTPAFVFQPPRASS